MLAPGSEWPCGCRCRLYFQNPSGHHFVSIYTSIPRLSNIWLHTPQLRPRYGNSSCRGWLSDIVPPAAVGHYARGCNTDFDSACPHLKVSLLGTAGRRLCVGGGVLGLVDPKMVLPAAEARYRPGQLASFSYSWTSDPPASRFLAVIWKSNVHTCSRILSIFTKEVVPLKICFNIPRSRQIIGLLYPIDYVS